MTHGFDKEYWEQHWRDGAAGSMGANPPNPYLARELGDLEPGTALDAGCGAGAEAIWLASHGWRVTAVDISAGALARAAERAAGSGASDRVRWVEADLDTWQPGRRFDLVTTHYAHSGRPQLDFYQHIADWVAPGGTLLVVGHSDHDTGHGPGHSPGHGHGHGGHEHRPPAEASATAEAITARLDERTWTVVTAEQTSRTLGTHGGRETTFHDVVVRATRLR